MVLWVRERTAGELITASAALVLLAVACGKSDDGDDDANAGDAGETATAGRAGSSAGSGSGGKGGKGGAGTAGRGGSAGAMGGRGGSSGTSGSSSGGSGNEGGSFGGEGGEGESGASGGVGASGGSSGSSGSSGSGASGGSSASGGAGGATSECTGDFTLQTAAEVQEFAALGCTVLDGTLAISSPTLENLDDLSPSPLTVITSGLQIGSNAELTSIQGLRGLERIGGSLVLSDNPKLTDLRGLEDLAELGSDPELDNFVLQGNAALTSIAALGADSGGIEILTGLVAITNGVLTSLEGLSGMVRPDAVTIAGNPGLLEIGGLAELEAARNLTVASNDSLVTALFPALEEVETATLTGNNALRTANFDKLETITQTMAIASNPVLTDIGTLGALTNVASLTISGNAMLPQCFVDEVGERVATCTCTGNDTEATCN
jgi:hypothetical protein